MVRSGSVDWFNVRVVVLLNGLDVGADYLCCCAYTHAKDFITHGEGYFIDMVRTAVQEARRRLCAVPRLRCAAV